jgi:5-methylcytosine-specific restriction endonuclease McrA
MSTYQYRVEHWAAYRDPNARRGRAGRPYRRWRNEVLKDPVPYCARCGRPIDKALHWKHPMAATAGHIVPLSRGGPPLDPANGQPEHRRCNLSAQASMPGHTPTPTTADRRW